MIERALAILFALTASSSAIADNEIVDSLAAMMQGEFSIAADGNRMTDRRIRIEAPDIGVVAFYLQVNQGTELSVYRQRVLVFEADGERVIQRAYSFKDPERWVDASAHDLAGLPADAVVATMPDGCETTWMATENGYRGYTDPALCTIISSRTGKPRRIESETVLTKETLSLIERGFDEHGNQLFGTEPGESLVLFRTN